MIDAVFCKVRKEDLGSNSAASCEYFRSVSSREELKEINEKNDEYLKAH